VIITYAVTDDNFNGMPWMPDGPASDFWAIVARRHGRTKWRRIEIAAPNTAPPWRSAGQCQLSSAGEVKMDMLKFSGSQFVKCADVSSGPIREKIAGVEVGKFDKPNLLFESGGKFSVNATNARTLIRAFGRDSESWVGHEVELFLGAIEYQGKDQEAVLLRAILVAETGKSPSPKKATKAKPDFDDSTDIEF
jgi:hypothetical protein